MITQEEKRIKIAEACGWKEHPPEKEGLSTLWMTDANDLVVFSPEGLPDYFNDLNACAEMERTLTNQGYWDYHQKLAEIVSRDHAAVSTPLPLMAATDVSATATQRAEAFGQTLNLWL